VHESSPGECFKWVSPSWPQRNSHDYGWMCRSAGPFVPPLQRDALDRVRALFVELEFKSLEERLSKLANGD
jgi:hypothetical protein